MSQISAVKRQTSAMNLPIRLTTSSMTSTIIELILETLFLTSVQVKIKVSCHYIVIIINNYFTYFNYNINSVHLEFSTPKSTIYEMMKNGRILKFKEKGKPHIIQFRIIDFEEIRIHFNYNKDVNGKFPVIEITQNALSFGRHIDAGVVGPKKPYYLKFAVGSTFDFFVYTNGTEIQFGEVRNALLNVLGFYHYDELDSLPFLGLSSTNAADWVLEEAVSGEKIQTNETFQRSLSFTCNKDPVTSFAEWTFPSGLVSENFSSLDCVPAHSCYLSNVTRDSSVSLASFRNHLGRELVVLDGVKVGDLSIAWCTKTGDNLSQYTLHCLNVPLIS